MPRGRRSSPLDEINPERWTTTFTTEFLQLVWVLEASITEFPRQAKLLHKVVAGPMLNAGELPTVPNECRQPPESRAAGEEQAGLPPHTPEYVSGFVPEAPQRAVAPRTQRRRPRHHR